MLEIFVTFLHIPGWGERESEGLWEIDWNAGVGRSEGRF